RITAPNLLKTQTGCQRKNRQSNRQKPEITGHAHQLTVLRSLQISLPVTGGNGKWLSGRHPMRHASGSRKLPSILICTRMQSKA
ncbi:hypothetical protein ACBR42_16510, partial [Komagataeibacter sp. SM21]